jgi:hypothetical protein
MLHRRHVVNANRGNAHSEGKRLREAHADQKRAHEAGSIRDGYCIESPLFNTRVAQCSFDDGNNGGEMSPRCDLRDNAPKDAVDILRQNDQRFQRNIVARAGNDGRRSLVARRLDSEHLHLHWRDCLKSGARPLLTVGCRRTAQDDVYFDLRRFDADT